MVKVNNNPVKIMFVLRLFPAPAASQVEHKIRTEEAISEVVRALQNFSYGQ